MGRLSETTGSTWVRDSLHGALWNIVIVFGFYVCLSLIAQLLTAVYLGSLVTPLQTVGGFLLISAIPLVGKVIYLTRHKTAQFSGDNYWQAWGVVAASYLFYLVLTIVPYFFFTAWFQSQLGNAFL
jgi:hypothetical protein